MFRKMTFRAIQSAFLLTASTTLMLTSVAAAGAQITENRTQLDIPSQPLASALKTFGVETDSQVLFSKELVAGRVNRPVKGSYSATEALDALLRGTNLRVEQSADHVFLIKGPTADARGASDTIQTLQPTQLAQAVPPSHAVETVTVTSSKLGGADVQSIPISITALSQEQLTASQTNGGPDLIKQVPNMTFTKTNFAGYSIQLRGIGTQAISVTTDPAVAVAFNDQPFIRNHFFEQEFFDVAQVEVLRGPQGTLYGRNATAGVVNITSAKPSDQFEAMASAEFGNYGEKRFEGMINLPVVDDRLAVRFAGEWTKRDGYTFNRPTNDHVDGRDLWSGRVTIGLHPTENLRADLVWEHFSEDDDRLRSGKQLCTTDPTPDIVGGQPTANSVGWSPFRGLHGYLSQGCKMGSLYNDAAFGVPDSYSLPYFLVTDYGTNALPYTSNRQSTDLRVIDSELTPKYKAKNDTVQLNVNYKMSPSLTFTSDTGFNHDFLYSTQDYNRFASASGVFVKPGINSSGIVTFNPDTNTSFMCDPQLGCSDKLVAMDLTQQKSWQANQEFRLASGFSGPFNFSVGGNYMHYETMEDYYVFINSMTMSAWSWGGDLAEFPRGPWVVGVSDNSGCLARYGGFKYYDPTEGGGEPSVNSCIYIDPNPVSSLNGNGHNYFRSQNPYVLNSYAAFGEAYYDVSPDLKLTTGLRWTQDQKHFTLIPSQLVTNGWGYPSNGVVDQQWDAITGRAAINWTPKLSFTDQTLVFGSYAHGYKAGGANPPGPVLPAFAQGDANPVHPLTFKPEYIDAYELGTKNTMLDGALTLNASAFYYNYTGYQISEIVDRTAINLNFDAKIRGAEFEAIWEPIPGLRFNASGGYQDARANKGESAVDLMDRTAGDTDWMVVRPFPTQASNCILPVSVVAALLQQGNFSTATFSNLTSYNSVLACSHAYTDLVDPVTQLAYRAPTPGNPLTGLGSTGVPGAPTTIPAGYQGFDPFSAPNGGAGFSKDLSRHVLPNAPPFTLSAGAQYSMPVSNDWAATLRTDFYWQDDSWARIFNDNPYDRIRSYTNLNLTLILTSQSGWQVMGYLKNVFNTTAITGAFLNSDDSNLTTNVFLTDPRLIGLRVTKNW